MKKLNSTQWRGLLLGGLLFGAAQMSATAGIFTWSAPTTVTTADAALAQTGTIVGAEVFGTDSKLVVLSDGTTVDFKSDFTVAQVIIGSSPGSAYGGFTNNDSGNTAFKATLTQFNYDNGPKTITVFGLTPGQLYSVQLFAMDRRDTNAAARLAYYQDPNDVSNVSATFAMGDNAYVIGTFTAPGTTVDIQEILPTQVNSGNINALVVRAIGTNIPAQITTQPQPATLYNGTTATLTAGALGTGPLSYQWQKSNIGGTLFTNVVNGGNISGANSNSLVIGSLVAGDEGDYLVVVSNPYGNATSSVVTLTVLAGTPQFVWSTPAAITTADATLNQSGSVVGAMLPSTYS